MKIARRMLFQLLGGVGLNAMVSARWLGAAPVAQPFIMLFDDISVATPIAALTTLLAPFSNLGIPVGFILKLGDASDTTENAAALATTLGDFLQEYPSLGEAITWLPDLTQAPPYFQIRKASDARLRLEQFFGQNSDRKPNAFAALTIAGQDREGDLHLEALRAAGFRNIVLMSQTSSLTASEQCWNAMPCIRGGLVHDVTEAAYDIIRSLRRAVGSGDMVMLSLSLKNISALGLAALQQRAEAIADTIGADMQSDRIFAALPREHVFWFGTGTERLIGLHIAAPAAGNPVAISAFTTFQTALTAAGIAFTVTGEDQDEQVRDDMTCRTLPAPIDQRKLRGVRCVMTGSVDEGTLGALAEAGLEVAVQPVGAVGRGMDENGLLRLSESLVFAAPPAADFDLASFAPAQDIIVAILPAAYASDDGRSALVSMLARATSDAASKLQTIPDFANAIVPADPVYRLLQTTRRDLAFASVALPTLTDTARATLIHDAKIAWSFFDRMTDTVTGLCPSTVSFDNEWSSIYRVLTMWDLASLIHATIASHELGLIDDAQFLARAKAIVSSLPAQSIGGMMLPNSEIATDRRAGLSRDYNACDTGRLLGALANLNRYPLSHGLCAEAVAKWDLQETVHDGRPHSVISGRLVPLDASHCAHYAARNFGLWGVNCASPYDDAMRGRSAADAKMGLLYAVAKIGAIGAEPLLLEGVELGLSAPSAFLADVLHTAQARSLKATGDLVCVSEGPLDRPPWFSYQGLLVDTGVTDPWEVQPVDASPDYATKEFRDATRVISTKAAFLWAALRPGEYSAGLLDYVRQHARASEAGYCSGTYAATAMPMKNYTDVNTNGVILQAIAYILRGYAPSINSAP